jgi:hypothetical protein
VINGVKLIKRYLNKAEITEKSWRKQ